MFLKRGVVVFSLVSLFFFLWAVPLWAVSKNNALVVTAFGSSHPEAIKSIDSFVGALAKERPDLKIIKAFTSDEIITKLLDTEHETASLPLAVSRLADEGYKNIGVLSLHIMPGKNYKDLVHSAARLQNSWGENLQINVSRPLVSREQDAFGLASYLIYSLPAEIKPGESVVFVGNSSEDTGSLIYPALNWALFLQGEKGSLYLALSLDNNESIKQAMQILKLNRRKVVWMIPLTVAYGSKAEENIFSTDDRSIASRFKDEGYTVRPYKRGLIDNQSVQSMWKSRLKRMFPLPEAEPDADDAQEAAS